MNDISRPQLAVYAVAAIAILLVGARYLQHGGGSGAASNGAAKHASGVGAGHTGGGVSVSAGSGPVVVDVTGAVHRPGVYRLGPGARVQEALRRAGGATGRAQLASINLAAKLTDGTQVLVPERGPGGTGAVAGSGTAGAGGASGPQPPVNLNTATVEQLDALDGVGPSTAQKIVEYRTQHGGFGSVADLDRVPGIGPKKVAALRDKVTV